MPKITNFKTRSNYCAPPRSSSRARQGHFQGLLETTGSVTFYLICSCLILSSTAFEPATAASNATDKSTLSMTLAYNNRGVNAAARNKPVNRGVNTRDRGVNRGLNVGNDAGVNANPAVNNRTVAPPVNEYNTYYGGGAYNNAAAAAAAAAAIAVPGTYCSRQCVANNIAPSWTTYCLMYCP